MKNIEELIRQDIKKSGLTWDFIGKHGVKIFEGTPQELEEILGFRPLNIQNSQYLEFPHFNRRGEYLFSSFKVYPSPSDGPKYLNIKNTRPRPYITREVWEVADKPRCPLLFTEGGKKALKALQEGTPAISISGVWNFKASKDSEDSDSNELWAELLEFKLEGRTIFLAFDMDLWVNPQVRHALWEFAIRLYAHGAIVKFLNWDVAEGKGLDDFLTKKETDGNKAATVLQKLKDSASDLWNSINRDNIDSIIRALAVTSIDEFKSEQIINSLAKKMAIPKNAIRGQIFKKQKEKEVEKPAFTEEEKEQAVKLLKSPDMLSLFLETCHSEYVGREKELTMLKFATISRKFNEGLSIVGTGPSSVGKSEAIKVALKTCPTTVQDDFTSVTDQYLLYRIEPLEHRVVTFYEKSGQRNSYVGYILRSALSEKQVKLGTIIKDSNGALVARLIEKSSQGLVFLTTYASGNIDYEFSTRVLKLDFMHDRNLQAQYYQHVARLAEGEQPKTCIPFRIWQVADMLTEPAEVVIPFASKIATLFPTNNERLNRDLKRLFLLINTCALMFQFQREKDQQGRIIATAKDYEIIYDLKDLFCQSIGVVPESVIKFLQTCKTLQDRGEEVTRSLMMKEMKISDRTVRRYMNEGVANDLLEVEGRGVNQKLRVIDIPKIISVMPSPEEIFSDEPKPQIPDNIPVNEGVSDNWAEADNLQCPVQVVENKEVNSNWTNGQPNEGTLFPSSPETTVAVLDKDVEAKEEKTFEYWLEKCRAAGKEEEFLDWCNQITGKEYGAIQDIPADALEMIVEFLNKCENVIETFCLQNQDKSGVS